MYPSTTHSSVDNCFLGSHTDLGQWLSKGDIVLLCSWLPLSSSSSWVLISLCLCATALTAKGAKDSYPNTSAHSLGTHIQIAQTPSSNVLSLMKVLWWQNKESHKSRQLSSTLIEIPGRWDTGKRGTSMWVPQVIWLVGAEALWSDYVPMFSHDVIRVLGQTQSGHWGS